MTLDIAQEPDSLSATAKDAKEVLPLRDLAVRGVSVRFGLLYRGRLVALEGKVDGQTMTGEARARLARIVDGPVPRAYSALKRAPRDLGRRGICSILRA